MLASRQAVQPMAEKPGSGADLSRFEFRHSAGAQKLPNPSVPLFPSLGKTEITTIPTLWI